MAKKKKRRRPSGGSSGARPPAPRSRPAPARSERREEARLARQAALRRLRRQRVFRRVGVWSLASVSLLAILFLITRTHHHAFNHALAARADRVAAQAGCTSIQSPPDQGREHVSGPITYDQQPPTSGRHNPSPLNAGVYSSPQPENHLVHSLEHGAVEIYYVASGSDALPQGVVGELQTIAQGRKVIMTPAPEPLDPVTVGGKTFATSVAFAAWDRLRQCPSTITVDQANVIARGFINEFTDGDNAPEAGRPI
jgi:Protein of unknown function (DUF3105)